ncbi:glycoside hydrolase family 3 protein [Arenibacter sp. GZD96]|uniref:glycoside hydrolase family 3 protein n=1 Tax=Aurantibrevibacter litoralis TaxID=3106030 RepID=UPI002AFE2B13|nr:glycoside hydrolase family 3 protein [Arenibacter sp. GZD-96]MEA1785058.1 glycoside hydrolase family 3 protein [Arenibacter sp. GZD-96]
MSSLVPYFKAQETLSYAEKVGQLFMPAAFINDSESEICQLEKLIQEFHVGGLCFFHSRASAATNFEGKKKIVYNQDSFSTLKSLIARYQKAAKYPLLISIDAEWGLAMRIENTPQYPYAITLGALDGHEDLIFELGKNIAKDCKAAGIHWNLSPVVDINSNPNNPVIGYRSFGEDKDLVTTKALAYIQGMQSEGILCAIKHFPGHGDTATDSHLGLPLIEKSKQELWENELYPFRKLIAKGIDAVMVGHLSVPALAGGSTLSSSISKAIITGLLRDEMGFKGVVISDALNMHAVSKSHSIKGELEWLAFDAGNDILCFAEHITEGIATILKKSTKEAINTSFERIWKLKEKAFHHTVLPNSSLSDATALHLKIAAQSLTVLPENKLDSAAFTDEKFVGISVGNDDPNFFFEEITKTHKLAHFSMRKTPLAAINTRIQTADRVLLALFPPKVKPLNNFDFLIEELHFIHDIITSKSTVLYLFGNPYVLPLLPMEKLDYIAIVYQDFQAFQENAAQHFLGKKIAPGKFPVMLKQI